MIRHRATQFLAVLTVSGLLLTGCTESSRKTSKSTSAKSSDVTEKSEDGKTAKEPGSGKWEGYEDVPYVELMEDVDGIKIPRVASSAERRSAKSKITPDVGNPQPKKEEATGDWLIIRMASEPKSLNPITETSASQSYITEYVIETLYDQSGETLEYEPLMASSHVREDSIKLAADYPGKERRIKQGDGDPATSLEIEYTKPAEGEGETIEVLTTDADGKPIGGVWVGIYPVGKVPGLPPHGKHKWSDADGSLKFNDLPTGKFNLRVGAEVFGESELTEDGGVVVTPKTPNNPLTDELAGKESLTLAAGEWQERHEEVFYTYNLRKEVKWSDGAPFTSKDLEFAFATIRNDFVDGDSLRIYYQDIVNFEALDTYTVRCQFRQQYFKSFEFTMGLAFYTPPWHQFEGFFKEDGKTLTLERLTPEEEAAQNKVSVHGQAFGKFFNTDRRYADQPLGTGPYTVDKWIQKDRVELVRNPNYWNSEKAGKLERIIFKFIPDDNAALQALKAGEIDFLYRMSAEQFFDNLKDQDWVAQDFVKARWYTPAFRYVGWNMLKPMFQDRKVRIALSLLVDVGEFLEKKVHGAGVLVSGSQNSFGPAYDQTVKPLGYDPETAKDLLADAGWADTDGDGILDKDGEKFEFEVWTSTGRPEIEALLQVMKTNYQKAGIVMEIRTSEWATFLDRIKKRDYGACCLAWASPLESDPYQIWHSSDAGPNRRGSNHVSYASQLADELIEQAQITLDTEKRARVFWSFHRVLDRDQPYLFLFMPQEFGVYHKRFRGVKWYPIRPGFDLKEWYVPKNEQKH